MLYFYGFTLVKHLYSFLTAVFVYFQVVGQLGVLVFDWNVTFFSGQAGKRKCFSGCHNITEYFQFGLLTF